MIDAGIGSIIFISSGSGLRGFIKEAAYCPGKHGQEGLMKVLSMEGEPYNIAVNTVTPGAAINTPMSHGHYTEEQRKRWIDPALLAPAFVWLANQDASVHTGERLDAWKIAQSLST
jgi:NAD(P)-dependent dehydrogenase (short-subunit alcohol dehydrogenase family)